MAGLRDSYNVFDPNYVPPSSNAPDVLPGMPGSVRVDPLTPEPEGEFSKGLRSATKQMQGDIYSAAELAGRATGVDAVEQGAAEAADEAYDSAAAVAPANVGSLFDIGSVTDFTDWAAYGLGSLAPFALSMAATAGAGALVGGAARAATLAKGVSAVDNARKVATAAKYGGAAGGWAGSAVPQTGTAYRDLKEEGAYNPMANVLEGGIIGLLDVAPASHLLTLLGTPKAGIARGIGRGILEQAPMEAVTEATQEGISAGFRKYELGDQYDMSGLPERLVEAGALGALGGGVAGGMAGGIRGFRDSLTAPVKTVYNRVRGIEDPQASEDFDPTEDVNYEGDYEAYAGQLDQNDLPSFDPNYQTFDELASPEDKYSQSESLLAQLEILNEPFRSPEPDKSAIRAQLVDVYRQVDPESTYRIIDGRVEGLRIPDNFASLLVPEESGNITGKTLSERITKAGQKLQSTLTDTERRTALLDYKQNEILRLQTEMGDLMTEKKALGEDADPEALAWIDSQYADLRSQRDKHRDDIYGIKVEQASGPFKIETVQSQFEKQAQNRYPDDKEMRDMYIADAARARFKKQWTADNDALIKMLDAGPIREEDQPKLSMLRAKVDNPTSYMEGRSSITGPPRAEIEALLEQGGLSPKTQKAYEKLLGKVRNPEVEMSLRGADLQGKKILRTVDANYKLPEYMNGKTSQFIHKGEAINMVNLTREARKQRQDQEKVFVGENKRSGKEKPPEEHGMETSAKQLFSDVMQGLGMLADVKGEGWLPAQMTYIAQSLPWPRAGEIMSSAGVKAGKRVGDKVVGNKKLSVQSTLSQLVKLVGYNTIVDSEGHTFGEVVASAAKYGFLKPKNEAGATEHAEFKREPKMGEDQFETPPREDKYKDYNKKERLKERLAEQTKTVNFLKKRLKEEKTRLEVASENGLADDYYAPRRLADMQREINRGIQAIEKTKAELEAHKLATKNSPDVLKYFGEQKQLARQLADDLRAKQKQFAEYVQRSDVTPAKKLEARRRMAALWDKWNKVNREVQQLRHELYGNYEVEEVTAKEMKNPPVKPVHAGGPGRAEEDAVPAPKREIKPPDLAAQERLAYYKEHPKVEEFKPVAMPERTDERNRKVPYNKTKRKDINDWRESKSFTYRDTMVSTQREIETMNNGFAAAMFQKYTKKIKAPVEIKYLLAHEIIPILLDQKPEWISKLMMGTLNGFKIGLPDGGIGVYVHPKADPQHAAEVVAHELGHAVFAAHIRGADDATIRAIANEYHGWLTKYGSRDEILMKDVLKSKKAPRSALVAMGMAPDTTSLAELNETQLDYLFSYEEWFADNVARYLTETVKAPQTLVEKFFAKVAAAIKWLKGLAPDGTVATLMEQIVGGRREWNYYPHVRRAVSAAPELNISAADMKKLTQLASSTMNELKDPGYMATVSVIEGADPYGALFHNAFGEFLMSDALQPHVRNMIMRAAMSNNIQFQMRQVFKHDQGALNQLSRPERSAAYMYQLWRAGLIKLGDRTDTHFTRIAKFFRDTLGVISDTKNSAEIFQQIEENIFPAFNGDLQRTAVQRVLPGSMADKIVRAFGPSYELVMKPMRTLFVPIDSRVRNSDNPYLREIADIFHRQPGQMNGNPTMWDMKTGNKGRYDNIIRSIFDGKDAQFGNEALDYLYGNKDLSKAPAGTQRVIERVRLLFKEMRKYQEEAGVEVNNLGPEYFPWVFNQEYVSQHVDELRNVLMQEKYEAKRIELAKYINKRTMTALYNVPANQATFFVGMTLKEVQRVGEHYAETGEWQLNPEYKPLTVYNSTEIAEYMLRNANVEMQNEFEMDLTRKNTPVMRFNNSRLFKFVDPKEIRPYLSNELGETIGLYTSQAVKHAEFVRRFGKDGEVLELLLQQAKQAGATPKQLAEAVDYVHASMGTYGRHTAEWLNKYVGIPLPEHDYTPINEKLNKGMGAAIVYQNMRYLGLATLTSLSDVMGIAVRSSDLTASYQGIKAYLHRNQTDLQDLAEMLGIIEHSQIADALGARYDGLHLTGKLRKFNDGFFKLIGLEAWTKATRIMALAAGESFIVKHATRPGKHSARWLTELNLTENDVKLTADGRLKVLSHGERYSASKEELARDDRIRSALIQFTDEAILRPNASMRTLWGSDPHYQLFQYLKSFMYTFHERILKRVGHEAMEGNYAAFIWLLSYIPVMFVSDLMREAIQFGEEGDPRKADWGFGDHLQNSAIRAGLLGYAQQGLEIHNDMKFGGYGFSGFAASFDTLMQAPDAFSGDSDEFMKALPGQTIYRDWLN